MQTLEKEGIEEKFSGSAHWGNKNFWFYLPTMPSHTCAHASFDSEWWLAETFVSMKARLPAHDTISLQRPVSKGGASTIQKISLAVDLALLKLDVN